MSTSPAPITHPASSVPRHRADNRATTRSTNRTAARIVRWTLSLVFFATGILIFANEAQLRVVEAQILAAVMNLGIADQAVAATSAGNPAVAFELAGSWLALRITIQCAIALYLGPVLMVAGLLVLSPRISISRVFLATTIGVASLVLLNQVRLVLIGFGYGTWGTDAFHWLHGPVGTGIMLVGIAAVLFVFVILCIRTSGRTTARRSATVRA